MLAILADDLTGALDSAAPFAGRGMHTQVVLDIGSLELALAERPQVLAINLGCREQGAARAFASTQEALQRLPTGARLFKKVDSRLKGNIVAELDAIAFRRAIAAPAIPDFGRIVKNGHVEGFGVDMPIDIAERLGAHSVKCSIVDTASMSEMRRALSKAEDEGVDLLIGARGLAEVLAVSMSGRQDAERAEIPAGSGLFVIGSRDPITLAQVEALTEAYEVDYRAAPNGRLHNAAASDSRLILVQATEAAEACAPDVVSGHLAAGVVPELVGSATTLILSGGATAEAVLATMRIGSFRLVGECLPGLGLAHVGGRCIIAKSGGFGQPHTLTDIANTILRKIEYHGAG